MKVGDFVIFTNAALHTDSPAYYPQVGVVGKILDIEKCPLIRNAAHNNTGYLVEWPAGTVKKNDEGYSWWCDSYSVRPF